MNGLSTMRLEGWLETFIFTLLSMSLLLSATQLWQGNVFTPVCQSFCSQGEGVCGRHIPRQTHTPRQTPLGRHTPRQTHPPGQTSPCAHPQVDTSPADTPWQTPPRHTPQTDTAPGHCSGRYASYWNAFLFTIRPHVKVLQQVVASFCGDVIEFLRFSTYHFGWTKSFTCSVVIVGFIKK